MELVNSGQLCLVPTNITQQSRASNLVVTNNSGTNRLALNDITNQNVTAQISNSELRRESFTPLSTNPANTLPDITQLRPVDLGASISSANSFSENNNSNDDNNNEENLNDSRLDQLSVSSFVFSQSDEPINTAHEGSENQLNSAAPIERTLNEPTDLVNENLDGLTNSESTRRTSTIIRSKRKQRARHDTIRNLYNNQPDEIDNIIDEEDETIVLLKSVGEKNIHKQTVQIPNYKEKERERVAIRKRIREGELRVEDLNADQLEIWKRRKKNERMYSILNNRIYINVRSSIIKSFFQTTIDYIKDTDKKIPISHESLNLLCRKVFMFLYHQGIKT